MKIPSVDCFIHTEVDNFGDQTIDDMQQNQDNGNKLKPLFKERNAINKLNESDWAIIFIIYHFWTKGMERGKMKEQLTLYC